MAVMKARHLKAAVEVVDAAYKAGRKAWYHVDASEDKFPVGNVRGCPSDVHSVQDLEDWVAQCYSSVLHRFMGNAKRESLLPVEVVNIKSWKAPE